MSPLQFRKYRVGIKVALCSGQWSESEKRSQIYFRILQKRYNVSPIHWSPFSLLHLCPPPCLLVAHDLWCLGFCDDLEISNISISDLTCCICQILTCVFVRYCCVYLSNIFMCISMIFSCVFLWFKMRLPDTIARRQEGLCLAAISEPRQTLCTLQYNTRCARYEISSIWIFVLFVKGTFPEISFHDQKIFVMLHIIDRCGDVYILEIFQVINMATLIFLVFTLIFTFWKDFCIISNFKYLHWYL